MDKKHPLALWREKNDLSQDEAGIRFGVTRWTINRIEVGERQPSPRLVKAISEKTGIPRYQLRPDIYEAAE